MKGFIRKKSEKGIMDRIFSFLVIALFLVSLMPLAAADEGNDKDDMESSIDGYDDYDDGSHADDGIDDMNGMEEKKDGFRKEKMDGVRDMRKKGKEKRMKDASLQKRAAAAKKVLECIQRIKEDEQSVRDEDARRRCAEKSRETLIERFKELDEKKQKKIMRLKRAEKKKLAKIGEGQISKVAEWKIERIEALARATRAKLKEAAESGEITEEEAKAIENSVRKRMKLAANDFRVRNIAEKGKLRKRFEEKKERLEEIRKIHKEKKEKFLKVRKELEKYCSEDRESRECREKEEEIREEAKVYLLNMADRIITAIEKIKVKAEEAEYLSEEQAGKITAKADEHISQVKSVKEDIKTAETKKELKKAAGELKDEWKRIGLGVKASIAKIKQARIGNIILRMESLEERLESVLTRLEDKGIDISVVDSLVDEFSSSVNLADEYNRKAKELFAMAVNAESGEEKGKLVREAQINHRKAQESLKKAQKTFKEIIRNIKAMEGGDDALAASAKKGDEDNESEEA